jgi:hypothetical protein
MPPMDEARTRENPPPRAARVWLAAAGVAVASLAALATLDAAGRAARDAPGLPAAEPEVLLVRTSAAAVEAWRARGVRGCTVVHAGRFLHFVSDEDAPVVAAVLTGPGRGSALDDALVRRAGPRNHLWVAAATGLAWRVAYVPPPRALDERLAALGLGRDAVPARLASETFPRLLLAAPPRTDERVVLDVNASWFDEGTPADLLDALRASGLRPALVTLSLAEDATDVSAAARAALRVFGATLAGRELEAAP